MNKFEKLYLTKLFVVSQIAKIMVLVFKVHFKTVDLFFSVH